MNNSQTILVTGGAGYIASWVICYLLEEGYRVRATVRDKSNGYKIEHLNDWMQKYPGSFEIFESDLLVDGSFDTAVDGCDIVMHTASPFSAYEPKDEQSIDPDKIKNVINVNFLGVIDCVKSVEEYFKDKAQSKNTSSKSLSGVEIDPKDL